MSLLRVLEDEWRKEMRDTPHISKRAYELGYEMIMNGGIKHRSMVMDAVHRQWRMTGQLSWQLVLLMRAVWSSVRLNDKGMMVTLTGDPSRMGLERGRITKQGREYYVVLESNGDVVWWPILQVRPMTMEDIHVAPAG